MIDCAPRQTTDREPTLRDDRDAESIYLEIRLRILHAQFLPDQIIDRALIIAHFQTSAAAANRALEELEREGYLKNDVRGNFAVRRLDPDEVLATFEITRRVTLVGARSLIRDPDQETATKLKNLANWSPKNGDIVDDGIEEFISRTREILKLLMRRLTQKGEFGPLRLFGSPALHRYTLHAMTVDDVIRTWAHLKDVCHAVVQKDLTWLASLLAQDRPYETALAELLDRVNRLPSRPSASFTGLPPEFHVLIGDDDRYPYFGLGLREHHPN